MYVSHLTGVLIDSHTAFSVFRLAVKVAAWALKYAACDGWIAPRAAATALATLGIVAGSYHRCGLGVESGSLSSCCTSMTVRPLFGAADSMVFMNPS